MHIVLQQGAQLQRVELEASRTDAGDVVCTALGGLQQVGCLKGGQYL